MVGFRGNIADGDKVLFSAFGKISLRQKKARRERNRRCWEKDVAWEEEGGV
jgi:nucleoid DNA-binding protein